MRIHIFDKMSGRNRLFLLAMLATTILLGSWEAIFGRVGYSGDAICYLNIVRAIHAGDWHLAFSSYWGFGYPLLISLVTPLFPDTPAGEWWAVHALNLVILIETFFTFFGLVWVAARTSALKWILADEAAARLLLVGSFSIFLAIELSLDNASRVGPDLLVSGLLFWCTRLVLELREKPNSGHAILLGVLLGLGFVVKSIFLPLTLLFLVVTALAIGKKSGNLRSLALVAIFAAVFAIPYIGAMSKAQGHFTYGDSGPLNYVWNVNKLEPGGLWQGQPPQFGKPLHPATMVSEMPHAYIFDGPFPVTFGPFFNPPYYYAGVHRFFSLKAQIHAFGGNILRLVKMLRLQIILIALAICVLLTRNRKEKGAPSTRTLWPITLISTAGIFVYLLVVLESRYIAAFVAMLFLVLLFWIVSENAAARQRGAKSFGNAALAWILIAGCALTLLANQKDSVRDLIGNTRHHRLFYNEDQWILGQYLEQAGVEAGEKVAIISDLPGATLSTWAYMDRLQIVGILGGSLLDYQKIDYDAFWNSTPDQQRALLEKFHQVGATTVVTISEPHGPGAQDWTRVPGTKFWIYQF